MMKYLVNTAHVLELTIFLLWNHVTFHSSYTVNKSLLYILCKCTLHSFQLLTQPSISEIKWT